MSPKNDEGFCVFGAIVLDKYLEALRQEVDGVRQAEDIEYIHRMRVASRRVRSALPLFSSCLPQKKYPGWEKEIKAITSSLGAARDTDVQLELLGDFSQANSEARYKPGLRRLILRLRQKRAKIQVKVNQALDTLAEDQTLEEIQGRLDPYLARQNQTYLYTPVLYQRGYEAISARLADFLSYEEFIHQPERIEELHAMRIAAKQLRYTLEIFAPLYPNELKDPIQAMRKSQDLLGEIHDSDVWISFLPEFIDRERERVRKFFGNLRGFNRLIPGIECFQADRQQNRQKKYADFLAFWSKHQEQGTWQGISQTIQIPSYRKEVQAGMEQET